MKLVCTSCGRKGHIASNCFRTLGYPDWRGDRPRGRSTSGTVRGSSSAYTHPSSTDPAQANAVSHGPPLQHSANTITSSDRIGLTGLNDEQWKTLVTMLNERRTPPNTLSGTSLTFSWIIDSGATNHMTGSLASLIDIRDTVSLPVKLPDGRITLATQQGTAVLSSNLTIQNVLFVNGLHCHLISVSQLARQKKYIFQITDKLGLIQDRITKTLIGVAEQSEGLYFLRGMEFAGAIHQDKSVTSDVWHHRLGHPSSKVLEFLPISVSIDSVSRNKVCKTCIRAKQTRCPFPISSNKTNALFEMVHCDLWGPYRTPARSDNRYFLTLVDDYSRSVWLYLLPTKTDVSKTIRHFISMVHNQFHTDIQNLRSDNGTEFMCMAQYFRDKGIMHETSCAGTPQQNGRAERKHRHILNVARALRFQASLLITYWGECIMAAAYLINRTPTPLLNSKTPYELLYNRPPPLSHLRVFGSLCYAHNQHHKGNKFASRSIKGVFLGYPHGQKGWRILNPDTGKFFTSRDVVFCESEFPYATKSSAPASSVETPVLPEVSPAPEELILPTVSVSPSVPDIVHDSSTPLSPEVTSDSEPTSEHSIDLGSMTDPLSPPTDSGDTDTPTTAIETPEPLSPPSHASLPPTATEIAPTTVPPIQELGRGL